MKKEEKIRTYAHLAYIVFFFVGFLAYVIKMPEKDLLPGLPFVVNIISIMWTLGLLFHFVLIRVLIFMGKATENDRAGLFGGYLIYFFLMMFAGYLKAVGDWLTGTVIYLTFVCIESLIPDWPKRIAKAFRKKTAEV